MNRLTRSVTQLNSPESQRFFVTATVKKPPLRRPLTSFNLKGSKRIPYCAQLPIFLLFDRRHSSKRRSIDHFGPDMESAQPESDPPASEDFVHIENPNVQSLANSIFSVEEPGINEVPGSSTETEEDAERSEVQRKVLPPELSRSVMVLTCETIAGSGVCDVFIVGTAHVSEESCREVEAVISYLKPEVVFLELCSSRVAVLTPQNLKVPTMGEMVDSWKKKHNIFGILYSWFLAKIASKLEVFPGSEFRVAYEEAMKYGGRVILGDRPVEITLRRTWGEMPLWHKIKLVFALLFQAVFLPSPEELNKMLKELDDVDMLTLVVQELSKEFPTLMETLVHERDRYMSSSLLGIAGEHNSVVAVVGKGHMAGIRKHWKQPIMVRDLMTMPAQKRISAVKISLGAAVAGTAIISGIYFACKK